MLGILTADEDCSKVHCYQLVHIVSFNNFEGLDKFLFVVLHSHDSNSTPFVGLSFPNKTYMNVHKYSYQSLARANANSMMCECTALSFLHKSWYTLLLYVHWDWIMMKFPHVENTFCKVDNVVYVKWMVQVTVKLSTFIWTDLISPY